MPVPLPVDDYHDLARLDLTFAPVADTDARAQGPRRFLERPLNTPGPQAGQRKVLHQSLLETAGSEMRSSRRGLDVVVHVRLIWVGSDAFRASGPFIPLMRSR